MVLLSSVASPLFRRVNLCGLFDGYQAFPGSGYRTLYQNKVLVCIDPHDRKVLHRNFHAAHVSRHTFALEYLTGRGAGAIGTLMAMELGTVCHRSSVLTVSLDRALESLTFGDRRRVHSVASLEDVRLDFAAERILVRILKLKLSDESLAGNACLIEMALLRLVCAVAVNHFFLTRLILF